jgi:hypothetical protein
MRKLVVRLTAALLTAVCVVTFAAVAQAAGPVKVGGGGTAAFTDERFGGLTTQFGIGVAIHPDGTADGNFTCLIKGILTLEMMVTEGIVNDDGSVSLSGVGVVHFAGGGMVVFDATLDVRAGGPGVGEFLLGPPTFADTEGDHEVVVTGGIMIIGS